VGSFGLRRALAAAGEEAYQCGFYACEPSLDGAPVEAQLERCAKWVASPSDATKHDVERGLDPTRQLMAWDEDMLPEPENAWQWYMEVGQCASAGVIRPDSVATPGEDYYAWPAGLCLGRGLVAAVRGLCQPGVEPAQVIAEMAKLLATYR
jgi:hypothetical protein